MPLEEANVPTHGALGCDEGLELAHDEMHVPVCDRGYTLSAPIWYVNGVLSVAGYLPNSCDVSDVYVANGSTVMPKPWLNHGDALDVVRDDGFERIGASSAVCIALPWFERD